MSRWKRLSVRDFKFTKVAKIYMHTTGSFRDFVMEDPWIDCNVWDGLTLFANAEGLYRLRKDGELLCEGDEFLLACVIARLENDFFQSANRRCVRTFVVDGEYAL